VTAIAPWETMPQLMVMAILHIENITPNLARYAQKFAQREKA